MRQKPMPLQISRAWGKLNKFYSMEADLVLAKFAEMFLERTILLASYISKPQHQANTEFQKITHECSLLTCQVLSTGLLITENEFFTVRKRQFIIFVTFLQNSAVIIFIVFYFPFCITLHMNVFLPKSNHSQVAHYKFWTHLQRISPFDQKLCIRAVLEQKAT